MGVVPGVVDPRGHRPRGGAPDSRRPPLLQRLVRTLLVEVLAKHIEALLLFARAERRWLRRLLRQRAVHPLVSPLSCGEAGRPKCGSTPSFSNHIDSRESPPAPDDPNGGPLSERTASGSPKSLKSRSKTGRTVHG